MIIVKLMGGLGNQMFQYAAGLNLSIRHNTPLLIDTSFLNEETNGAYTKRNLELDVFNLSFQRATEEQLKPFLKRKDRRLIRILIRLFPQHFNYCYIAESGAAYHHNYCKYPTNTYLDGFWQSERYFLEVEQELRKVFVPNKTISERNAEVIKSMESGHSVSLHIRRGDYVNNALVKAYHGLCGKEYYERAIHYLTQQLGSLQLFVFSDDITWCVENIKTHHPVQYIDHNKGSESYWDMCLMSRCKHNIIANSSFSWWAAWLNSNKHKLVIAPDQWLANESKKEAGDRLPPAWIRL